MILTMLIIFALTGCGGQSKKQPTTSMEEDTDANQRYNSTDMAVVIKIDLEDSQVSFKSLESGSTYTLTFTGGTKIRSKNDVELTMSQVDVGELVDVYYVLGSQRLIEMKESSKAWENTSVIKWNVDYDLKKISIGSTTYKYDDSIFISSNGKQISIEEVSGVDELIVKGVDNKVCSVVVKKGHGYVKLVDDTNMIDGLIEVGPKIMTVITKDMVIVAPEGTYNLTATKNGSGGTKEITVVRDEELIVSLSQFATSVTRYGDVNFTINPGDAQAIMYIDGVQTDYSDIVNLSFGNHRLVLTSNNYDTYSKTITIASLYTNINIDMSGEEETTSEEATTSEETTSEEETTAVSTGTGTYNNKVYIVAPNGATAYYDGVSLGSVPCSVEKTAGTHTVLLMQTGYESKVYTLYLDGTREDVALTYPEMTKN